MGRAVSYIALALAVLSCGSARNVQAELITFEFSGVLTEFLVDDHGLDLQVGDPFNGTVTYDTSVPMFFEHSPGLVSYSMRPPQTTAAVFNVQVGGVLFSSEAAVGGLEGTPWIGYTAAVAHLAEGDFFLMGFHNLHPIDDDRFVQVELMFSAVGGGVLSDTSIPGLSQLTDFPEVVFGISVVDADISTVIEIGNPKLRGPALLVPEPSTLALLCLGAVLLLPRIFPRGRFFSVKP